MAKHIFLNSKSIALLPRRYPRASPLLRCAYSGLSDSSRHFCQYIIKAAEPIPADFRQLK
jgi:hypothetical protein